MKTSELQTTIANDAARKLALEAEVEHLRTALSRIAGKNNLAGVSDDMLVSALHNALQECEIIAREALEWVTGGFPSK